MATATKAAAGRIEELLGADADDLLNHRCETVPASQLHLPGPDFVDRIWSLSDRPIRVLRPDILCVPSLKVRWQPVPGVTASPGAAGAADETPQP